MSLNICSLNICLMIKKDDTDVKIRFRQVPGHGEGRASLRFRCLNEEESPVDAKMRPASIRARPRRLAWPRTSPFHGGNTGSNPVGDAKSVQQPTNSVPPRNAVV